jgi:hypothetical protein
VLSILFLSFWEPEEHWDPPYTEKPPSDFLLQSGVDRHGLFVLPATGPFYLISYMMMCKNKKTSHGLERMDVLKSPLRQRMRIIIMMKLAIATTAAEENLSCATFLLSMAGFGYNVALIIGYIFIAVNTFLKIVSRSHPDNMHLLPLKIFFVPIIRIKRRITGCTF